MAIYGSETNRGYFSANAQEAGATSAIPGIDAHLFSAFDIWKMKTITAGTGKLIMRFLELAIACTVASQLGMQKRRLIDSSRLKMKFLELQCGWAIRTPMGA
ncbi:hypothetical protein M514_05242 [Trichuris suis]|uniref:Uncharacterized protein n=1 Tax=Trichuris suis TaxID=68888 RepID=A0A085ND17_9BILA|nr:hypothetical protein M513_05242 [Trichuris suis]KFD67363.1 hypothetical protein M514_05242 [Trichuris suis]